MKAHINGITVEGTPQEIMEYQRLQAEQSQMKPQKQSSIDADWLNHRPITISSAQLGDGPITLSSNDWPAYGK